MAPTLNLNLDASENLFLARELERIRPELYMVEYPELKGRMFLPIDNQSDPGMERVTYRVMRHNGQAKVIRDYSTDLPRVDVGLSEVSQGVVGIGDAYGYSVQEVRAAMRTGRPLDALKARAARDVMERLLEDLMLDGDSAEGIQGFFGLTSALTVSPLAGAVGTTWDIKTPREKVRDLHALVNAIPDGSNEILRANAVILPTDVYRDAQETFMGDGASNNVLEQFIKESDSITSLDQIQTSYRLKTKSGTGAHRAMAYRKDPTFIQAVIPQEFEQFAPQPKGLETVVACHMRYGGIENRQPKAVAYMDDFFAA